MNKHTIKSFIAWLDTATEAQISAKREEVSKTFAQVSSREGTADLRLCLRLIDEEIIARLELSRLDSRPG